MDTYIKTVRALTYQNYDIYLSDNSDDYNYHRNVYRKYGVECGHIENEMPSHPMSGITQSQNQIRNRFLYGNYQYFFSLEEDAVCHPDTIQVLLSHKKQVVSVPYFISLESESEIAMMDLENTANPINRRIPFNESFLKITGKVIETKGSGIACCLIHRSVLEQIPFGYIREKKYIPSDTYFYVDCHDLGIKIYLDTSLIAKHNNQQWIIT